MKILWVVDLVLPDFCKAFGFRQKNIGGWMTGMLHQVESMAEIAMCFPIYNPERAKDGEYNGHMYYSFPFRQSEYDGGVKDRFKEIIKSFQPDIVHIWGTEYPHTLAMVNASEEMGMLNRVVINIQGLVSVCARQYCDGLPDEIIDMESEGFKTIRENCEDFAVRGENEEKAIKKVKHVIGRTDWDKVCAERMNKSVHYYFCGEILRDEFYEHINEWEYETCEKQSIFISQAGYPLKGFHYLLEAMPDILEAYPQAHVYVSGNDVTAWNSQGKISPYGIYIRRLIEKYELADKVTFTGMLNATEMIDMYLRANVFVSVSNLENSPNSICEASLIGCPVVASYVGGVPNLAEYIDRIELYQHDAEYMLAYKIKNMFENSGQLKKAQGNRILEMIDRRGNGKAMLKIYQKLGEK